MSQGFCRVWKEFSEPVENFVGIGKLLKKPSYNRKEVSTNNKNIVGS